MRIGVCHLTGARRGSSEQPDGRVVRLGTAPDAQVCLAGAVGVLPQHAELVHEAGAVHLRPNGEVRLNGEVTGEAVLKNGDLLELGADTRLRIQLLADSVDYHALLARAALTPGGRPGRGSSTTLLIVALLVVAGAFCATYLLSQRERREANLARRLATQSRMQRQDSIKQELLHDRLRADLSDLAGRVANRADVEERVGAVQAAVAEVESNVLRRVNTEIQRSIDTNPALRETIDSVKRMERDTGAGGIIQRCAPAVCLVQGSYAFGRETKTGWRYLREASPELLAKLEIKGDKVPLMLEGDGDIFTVEFTGTGFLVDGKGLVLTNRHIAEPWWHNDSAAPLLDDGFEPRMLYLRVYFPGRKKAIRCLPSRSLISDVADLALLRLRKRSGLPKPLELAHPDSVMVGHKVVLLGYPSGLNALLARTDDDITGDQPFDPIRVLDTLAERNLVRPLPTRGHISDLVENKVLFDAPTAVGGSGGPLLNMQGHVVAINYGILKSFSGANFGVPVEFAHALLAKARAR